MGIERNLVNWKKEKWVRVKFLFSSMYKKSKVKVLKIKMKIEF